MMENKDDRKVCEGCKFYKQNLTFSDGSEEYTMCRVRYPVLSSTEQCPCLACIVKGMCTHTCEDFFKYRDRVLEVEYWPKIKSF